MDHVYKIVEIVGSSTTGIEDAVDQAIATAGKTVKNLQWFEVQETRGNIENGKVAYYQVVLRVGFRVGD